MTSSFQDEKLIRSWKKKQGSLFSSSNQEKTKYERMWSTNSKILRDMLTKTNHFDALITDGTFV